MVTIVSFLFVFSLIVVVHELGHFFAARAFGIRVDRFSLGFGKALLEHRDKHGTIWTLAMIPLGGYVKFFGDASAASNPDTDRLTELRASIEQSYGREAVATCYHFKPVWQRAIVAAAGPFANFVLAIAIFVSAVAVMGDTGYPPVVGAVHQGSPAETAGLQKGDRILRLDGRAVRYFRDIEQAAALAAGNETTVTVERGGQTISLPITIGREVVQDPFGGESSMGYIGVEAGLKPTIGGTTEGSPAEAAGFLPGDVIVAEGGKPVDYFTDVQDYVAAVGPGPAPFTVLRDGREVELVANIGTRTVGDQDVPFLGVRLNPRGERMVDHFGPVGAFKRGLGMTWDSAAAPVRYVSRTLRGREDGRELGGVLRIGKVTGEIATQSFDDGGIVSALVSLVMLAGALSVSIGLLNLLPIPILDGGHLVYYAYEAVVGRPLGEGAQEWGFRIGLALVLGLMIFTTWNDLRYLRVFEAIGNVLS